MKRVEIAKYFSNGNVAVAPHRYTTNRHNYFFKFCLLERRGKRDMIPLQSIKNIKFSKETEPTTPFILVYIYLPMSSSFVHHEKENLDTSTWKMPPTMLVYSREFFYRIPSLCPPLSLCIFVGSGTVGVAPLLGLAWRLFFFVAAGFSIPHFFYF